MCDQTTTNICNQLAAQANVLRVAEQHEVTIAAALALPEAERMRLWMELGKEFAPPAYNASELDHNRRMKRERDTSLQDVIAEMQDLAEFDRKNRERQESDDDSLTTEEVRKIRDLLSGWPDAQHRHRY